MTTFLFHVGNRTNPIQWPHEAKRQYGLVRTRPLVMDGGHEEDDLVHAPKLDGVDE